MGELSNQAAVQRTKDFEDILGFDMCSFMNVVDQQTANWSRDQAQDMMTNWLSSGEPFDAVLANNDEMAIGAIQAMKAGDLDVTVFQNAAGQGAGALQAALDLAAGQDVATKVFIPFELVTPENVSGYTSAN